MSQYPNRIYSFGSFRLDVAERLLLREGKPVPVTPKVFDLLLVLVKHQGHLLEKDELMRAVWPDAVVEEANLSANISILRKALGDGINGQGLIETVPKRGYRFIAPVKSEPIVAPEAEAASRRGHSPTDPAIILVVEVFQIDHHIVVLADSESAAEHTVLDLRNRLASRL